MKTIMGKFEKKRLGVSDLIVLSKEVLDNKQMEVDVCGSIVTIRKFKEFSFVVLRVEGKCIQLITDENTKVLDNIQIEENMTVSLIGDLKINEKAPFGFEIHVKSLEILSTPYDKFMIDMSKRKLNVSLETNLNNRPITLRHQRMCSMFRIQAGIIKGFSRALNRNGFTEIKTPKIVSSGAEGGSNIFKLDYFGQKAFLAQSPQFYKQTMVGVYDRVFEIGPVFRAEKHSTPRHLNEYISLDFEMGYIKGFEDIMNMETVVLKEIFNTLKEDYSYDLQKLQIEIPNIEKGIPCVKFSDAIEIINKEYKREIKNPFDLQPDQEVLIGKYFKEKYESDLVFVTHYPSKKRPFYTINDPEDDRYTLSFDLLYKGMEITTGGQRIHDYSKQVEKMEKLGMNPLDFESYLMIHKYGMPPHGGLGIGLERFTMKLAGEDNIRTTGLFPRDRTRLIP